MAKKPLAKALDQLEKAFLLNQEPRIVRRRDLVKGGRLYQVEIPGPRFCGVWVQPSVKHCGFTIEITLSESPDNLAYAIPPAGVEAWRKLAGQRMRFRLGALMDRAHRDSLTSGLPDDSLHGDYLSDFWWNLLDWDCFDPTPADTQTAFDRIPAVVEHAERMVRELAVKWFVAKQAEKAVEYSESIHTLNA